MGYNKLFFSDGSNPRIIEIRENGIQRIVDEDQPRYVAWLALGNLPTPTAGDRFVTIVEGTPVIDPNRTATLTAEKWVEVRRERNTRVSAADWTQLDDAPFDASNKQQWRTYRQALRDLPQAQTDPYNITWPTPPEVQ